MAMVQIQLFLPKLRVLILNSMAKMAMATVLAEFVGQWSERRENYIKYNLCPTIMYFLRKESLDPFQNAAYGSLLFQYNAN